MFEISKPSFVNRIRFGVTGLFSRFISVFGFKQKQLVVCGFPRGGTSLLYNMFSATSSDGFKFTDFEKYFIYLIHKIGNIASKAPLDIMHLDSLDRLNIHRKQLVVIIVVRDIRDIVTSKHPIFTDDFFIGFDHSYWPQDKNFSSWSYDAPGAIQISQKISEASNRDDVMLVKYEDLVSDPDNIQANIIEKFGLSFQLPFSKYHEAQEKLAYKYEGRYAANDNSLVLEGKKVVKKEARWKQPDFERRIYEQFSACPSLFTVLKEFGYENNDDWFEYYNKKYA